MKELGIIIIILSLIIISLLITKAVIESDMPFWLKFWILK